jgi:hypothetical protein
MERDLSSAARITTAPARAAAPTSAALLYSLIESTKLYGVDPKRYLLPGDARRPLDRAAVTLPHKLLA